MRNERVLLIADERFIVIYEQYGNGAAYLKLILYFGPFRS